MNPTLARPHLSSSLVGRGVFLVSHYEQCQEGLEPVQGERDTQETYIHGARTVSTIYMVNTYSLCRHSMHTHTCIHTFCILSLYIHFLNTLHT